MRLLPYIAPRGLLKSNLAVAYGRPEALSEATLTRYRDMMLAPGVRSAMLARMGQTILRDPAPTLARIQAPTLLLWGEKDGMIPIANAADYLRLLPHATLVRLPNLGHLPFEEDPATSLPRWSAFWPARRLNPGAARGASISHSLRLPHSSRTSAILGAPT